MIAVQSQKEEVIQAQSTPPINNPARLTANMKQKLAVEKLTDVLGGMVEKGKKKGAFKIKI